jgi:hypothetical protein
MPELRYPELQRREAARDALASSAPETALETALVTAESGAARAGLGYRSFALVGRLVVYLWR